MRVELRKDDSRDARGNLLRIPWLELRADGRVMGETHTPLDKCRLSRSNRVRHCSRYREVD